MDRNKLEMLDTLTAEVTAFRTWADFRKSMEAGYIPTLWPRTLRKNANLQAKTFNKAVSILCAMLREQGFRVFDGIKTA